MERMQLILWTHPLCLPISPFPLNLFPILRSFLCFLWSLTKRRQKGFFNGWWNSAENEKKGLNQFDFWGVVPIQFHVDYEEDCLAHSIPVKGPKSGENGLVEIEIKSNDWEEHENWGAKNNFYYCISKVRNLFLLLVDLLEGYFLSFY